jgi:hypothetical protein
VLSLLYLSALEAGGAHAHTLMRSLHDRAYRAQIHVPAPLGDVMGVADVVSKLRPFAAHFAYACHDTNSRITSQTRADIRPVVSRFLQEPAPPKADNALEGSDVNVQSIDFTGICGEGQTEWRGNSPEQNHS